MAMAHLADVQALINAAADKPAAANAAWTNRTANAAFEEIRQVLESMCVGTGICNYCESNEATDIEHISPKAFFPELAFVWANYLLACKICNTHYKLDKIAVFNPFGSTTRYDVPRGTQPPTTDAMFINPRSEDPLHFLELNLRTGVILEKQPAGSRDYLRAKYTLEALGLDRRDALREAREARTKDVFKKLQYAVSVAEATNFADLEIVINTNEPFIILDSTRPLADVKRELLDSIRNAIVTAPHPTVWVEMKQQHVHYPRIADLFTRLPEALTW